MIKIQHVVGPSAEQMEFIIEGMRNPKNSWDRSDSMSCDECYQKGKDRDANGECRCDDCVCQRRDVDFVIGNNDMELMESLAKAGTEHRKYMRMMPIYARITAPLYWWKEFDTYKIGTVANSCSTMHKIQEKEFALHDFSHEHLFNRTRKVLKLNVDELNYWRRVFLDGGGKDVPPDVDIFNPDNNEWIDLHLKPGAKEAWWQMIQLLGSSYNQTRNVMFTYENRMSILHQRSHHKLDEWHYLCDWMKTLPYCCD